jgi:hypothetical protein
MKVVIVLQYALDQYSDLNKDLAVNLDGKEVINPNPNQYNRVTAKSNSQFSQPPPHSAVIPLKLPHAHLRLYLQYLQPAL